MVRSFVSDAWYVELVAIVNIPPTSTVASVVFAVRVIALVPSPMVMLFVIAMVPVAMV